MSKLRQARERGRWAIAVVSVIVVAGLLAACGSSSSSSSSSSGGGASSTAAGSTSAASGASTDVAYATAYLKKWAGGKNVSPLPTNSPTPKKDQSIWFISCGQAASGCAFETDGAESAITKLKQYGWKLTVFDTKLDPSRYATGIEQAIVAHANAIILGSVDCGTIKPQIEQATKAGILVIGNQAFDCGDPTQGGTSNAFSATAAVGPSGDLGTDVERWGAVQAAWAVVHTNGNVEALNFTNNQNAVATYLAKGFDQYLKQHCSSCQPVQAVPFLLADLAGPLQQKAATALIKDPSANIIATPYDPAAAEVALALTSAGKQSKIGAIGAVGVPQAMSLIKAERGQTADVGVDEIWLTYECFDDIIRLEAGKSPINGGFGVGIIDQANATPGKFYHASVNYEANYAKIWAAGGGQ